MLTCRVDWEYEVVGARHHYLLEAVLADAVIGRAYGRFEAGGAFIVEKIEVDPPYRSLGYGRHVIETLRHKARDCACTEFVFKGVRVENHGAIRLYESLGAAARPQAHGLVSFVLAP